MRDTPPAFVALLVIVLVAVSCSPEEAAPSSADAAGNAISVDAEVDPVRARAARIRAAAGSVCREICACGTQTIERSALSICFSITLNCCGGFGTYYIDATACELTFMDRLEAANAACEANGPGDCACQGLEHCLAWAESTTCDSNAVPEAAVLFVPQSCYGHGPGPDDACCDDPPEGECPWVPSE